MINPIDINSKMFEIQGKNLENLESSANNAKDDKKKLQAAQEFEAMFLSKFMNTKDSTIERDQGIFKQGQAEKTFKSMLYNEIALNVAKDPSTSVGIAKQVYEQMKEL
ncbi:MAG: rod-binding protein [Candidatus Gastranaerophilales bacterium]|nr:rod-binding protein [Candidatus Gastranaerophilales bacterium]